VVHPSRHDGVRILRRGYNFVDGSNALGALDAGLFFIAYVRDPRSHFTPLQMAMSRHDALTEYLQVTGSGVWAVPAGVHRNGWWGQELFA
jgi:deferrochelatase/peroxidase EfeB